MLAFLLMRSGIWTTDSIHGLHPVVRVVAVVVVLAFLPGIGVADFQKVGETDFLILFFIATVFAIGDGLAQTGFTDSASQYLLALFLIGAPLMVVFGVTFLLAFLMKELAVASVLTPC